MRPTHLPVARSIAAHGPKPKSLQSRSLRFEFSSASLREYGTPSEMKRTTTGSARIRVHSSRN